MATYVCPKGHDSTEPDFCSECGARIQGAPAAPVAAALAPSSTPPCPDCGAPRSDTSSNFCEICGYNFSTGAHGTIPEAPAPPEPPPPPPAAPRQWTIEIAVDPSLRDPSGPEAPADVAPITIALDKPVSLIGRRSEKRAILPEIPIDHDDGVSHRHALITRADDGSLILRDIGSSNGTRLNAADVQPMANTILHDGDRITLGRWTRITVKAI